MISKIVSRTEKNKLNRITASVVLDFFLLDMGPQRHPNESSWQGQ